MANRNNKAAANAAAAPAKAPVALRAAAALQKHGLAALPRIAAAAPQAAASAKRYGQWANSLPTAFLQATFTLTKAGAAVVAANGVTGATGRPTAMGLTVCAFANAAGSAATGATATGGAIVAAMLGNPALVAALLATKANGHHVNQGTATVAKFAQGYVNGMARTAHGYATKA